MGLLWWASASAQSAPLSDNADSIAVVVGNKAYKQTSTVDFAHNDAEAIRAWLIGTLGFHERNVFLVKDATLGELNQIFGSEANPQSGRIWRRATEGRSNVFVYYSGHGVPDLGTRQAILLPQDGDPNLSESGYRLDTLDRNLELVRQKIGPQRHVIVMIDACFTGETGRKGESLLAVSAPGFVPSRPRSGGGIVKLVATSGASPANWDQNQKLGLFTSRFLMGAAGLARASGAGQGSTVSFADLRRYLGETVPEAARRDSGREQIPEVDEAAITLPVGTPVAAVAGMVASGRDEQAWRWALASGERLALEDYIARCGAVCRYREAALTRLSQLQRDAQIAVDRQNWQRLSAEGKYGDYLKGCGAICAYRELAENYLPELRAARDPSIRKCDELAGHAGDLDRNRDARGVAFDDLPADAAIAACRAASELQPQLRRLGFQLGRAYDKAKRPSDAVAVYRKASQAGSAAAMRNLAYLLENGEGSAKDEPEARRLYEKAAQAGHVEAMNNLAIMLEKGRGGPEDLLGARRWYQKAAEAGHGWGMRNFALALQKGWGGLENLPEARVWYEKAARVGNADAMTAIGVMLEHGQGGPADLAEARRWYEKAAQAGDAEGMRNFGFMLEKARGGPENLPEARRWYVKSAEAGNAGGMNNLGVMLETGRGGPANLAEARLWYEKAARAGDGWGMRNFGFLLEKGRGGPEDLSEARRWYARSAEAGNAWGMNNLGVMLETGRGGPANLAEARLWYEKSAQTGYPVAMNNLGVMLAKGRGGPEDLREARLWYEKAAQTGHPAAMNNFGFMLEKGRGGPRDLTAARDWYEKAALAGNEQAKGNLRAMQGQR
ncbi:caspase family protein [Bosea eneae]|uniref:Caspase family protein n=1 Tax=Bosea eneae TaxID=151454 RepID=A0ABW0IWZ3_9HYPH